MGSEIHWLVCIDLLIDILMNLFMKIAGCITGATVCVTAAD
jgi:hypothetical protein